MKDSETWGNVRTCGMWLVRGMRLCVCVEYSYVGIVWVVWLRRGCVWVSVGGCSDGVPLTS